MENTERKNKKPRLHWGKVGALIIGVVIVAAATIFFLRGGFVGPILDDSTTTSTNQGTATE